MTGPECIYLSPHLDDAVFSCGGTIHRQAQSGRRVLVITVFAASPDPDLGLSGPALGFHSYMDAGDNPVAVRRSEDTKALAFLGAEYRHLPLLDCIYRQNALGDWLYPEMTDVFGPMHDEDKPLADTITESVKHACQRMPDPVFHVPLGIGNHVDHRIVHLSGRLLARYGHDVIFYEDYPYADPARQPAAKTSAGVFKHSDHIKPGGRKMNEVHAYLEEKNLQARIRGMCAYRSQLREFDHPAEIIEPHLRQYLTCGDPPRLLERFWSRHSKPLVHPVDSDPVYL